MDTTKSNMDSNDDQFLDRKKGAIIFATFIFAMALTVVTILAIASPIFNPELIDQPYIRPELTTISTEKSYTVVNATAPTEAQTNGSDLFVNNTVKSHSVSTTTPPETQTKSSELVVNITARTHGRFVTTVTKEPQTKDPDFTYKTGAITYSM